MKRVWLYLLPLAVVFWGCKGDSITSDDTEADEGISVDCSALNTDIAALQVVSVEAVAGSTVTDLSGGTITFSSGSSASVTARDAYGFSYANPTISVGSSSWIIDGAAIDAAFADETLKIKGSKGYWYAYYGSAWNKMNEILEGESIPVFASLSSDSDSVYVKLSDGLTISFGFYKGSDRISLSETSASMAKEGGSATVTVTSTSDWTAASSQSWISLSASSGTSGSSITVTASANEDASRSGYVTFTSGDVSAKFVVSQDGEMGGGYIDSADTEESDDNVGLTEFDRTIYVAYSSSGATITGDSNGIVTVNGNKVVADNTGTDEKVIYELSGTASDGYFKLYSDRKQAIVLNGVSITSSTGAAINVQGTPAKPNKGKRTFVVVNGTNTLADASSAAYSTVTSSEGVEEDQKAVFFGEGQLVFSGSGSLTINANNKKSKSALASDDYVRFMSSPTVTINAGSSAGHGVKANDYIKVSAGTISATVAADMKKGFKSDSLVRIDGGVTTIKVTGSANYDSEDDEYSGSAGIKADLLFEMTGGTVNITNSGTGGKGIKVGGSNTDKILVYLTEPSKITGGTLNVDVTGSNYTKGDVSAKGIKIGWAVKNSNGKTYSNMTGDLEISGGSVNVTCKNNEALEVKKTITVSGGSVFASSSSDDAINSASTFTINDGYVCGLSTSNDALDANGNFFINGGVVMACGKAQPDLAIDANTEGGFKLYVKGGTLFTLAGLESGASLTQSCYSSSSVPSSGKWCSLTVGSATWAFKAPSSVSSPLVVSGSSQPTLKTGVTVSGGTSYCNGYVLYNPTVSGGSSATLDSYTSGSGTGPGSGGNPGGGGHGRGW